MFTKLIPLKPNSLLLCRKSKLNILNLMLNVINESIEACECFLNKKYIAFDAQVGDTSCQIRAYKICHLAQDQHFITEIQILIPQIIKYKNAVLRHTKLFVNNMRVHTKYFKDLDQKENKEKFFNKVQLSLTLEDDCLFIILSYFLNKYCIFDHNNAPNAIDYSLIRIALNIGSTTAHNLAGHYQSILSRLSCDFILQQSLYAVGVDKNFLQNLLKIGDGKRYMLPYYFMTKILISSIDMANLPIIFSFYNKKQTECPLQVLFFKKDQITNNMVLQLTPNDIDKHTPAIIFRCDVFKNEMLSTKDFEVNILQIDVKQVILFNAANHPQYTGEILNNYMIDLYKDILPVDQELEKIIDPNYKELNQARIESDTIPCSQNNFGFFYIKHIFCSTLYDEQNTLFYGEC